MKLRTKISGADELKYLMRRLPQAVARNVIRGAVTEVSRPLLQDMRQGAAANMGSRSGAARKSIGLKFIKKTSPYSSGALVGARYGRPWNAFYIRFYEQGTKVRTSRKRGRMLKFINREGKEIFVKEVAAIPARPFIGPAIDRHAPGIPGKMADALTASLYKTMKRALRQAKAPSK